MNKLELESHQMEMLNDWMEDYFGQLRSIIDPKQRVSSLHLLNHCLETGDIQQIYSCIDKINK